MEIRRATEADAAAIARVHVESWRSTYRGLLPEGLLDSLSLERRTEMWQRILREEQPSPTVFVAEGEAGVAGFASGGPERSGDAVYTGELYAVYLLAEAQGRGAGRQLVAAVARDLATAGHRAMLVWVLAANPSRRFYEALGGPELRSRREDIGDLAMDEVAYGWRGRLPLGADGQAAGEAAR